MEFKSEFHVKWDDYVKQNPDIADVKSAKIIDNYEDEMVRFILGLFV